MVVSQGDIYWVSLKECGARVSHPHVVIQDNVLNRSCINPVVVCALTTNLKRAKGPGNVLLEVGEGNLPRQSVVVVSQVSTVEKAQLGEYIGSLTKQRIDQSFGFQNRGQTRCYLKTTSKGCAEECESFHGKENLL